VKITAEQALRHAVKPMSDYGVPYIPTPLYELRQWVADLLGDRTTLPVRVSSSSRGSYVYVAECAPKMDGSDIVLRLSPRHARAMAAELLRAADEAEASVIAREQVIGKESAKP
jgi:hypothetical protein